MNRKRIDPSTLPYDPSEFADKHGLTFDAALAVLSANSKSKEQADIGADLFKRARDARVQRVSQKN